MNVKKALTFASVLAVMISMIGILSVGAAPSRTAAQQPYLAGTAQTFVVLYKTNAVSSDAATVIANAGGSLVYSYNKIGVVIARSDNELFRDNLLLDKRVDGVSATDSFGVQLNTEFEVVDATEAEQAAAVEGWGDPLSGNQWDMIQIHVPEAHEINSGSEEQNHI